MRKLVNYGVFYSVWVAMIIGETYAWAIAGYVGGICLFTVGGIALARFHHRRTTVGEKPFGWPLQFASHLTSRNKSAGLVINTLLNGAPGVSIVETALGFNWMNTRVRVIAASAGYALLWCLVHYLRPHGVAPIYWHPSLAALFQVWNMIVG